MQYIAARAMLTEIILPETDQCLFVITVFYDGLGNTKLWLLTSSLPVRAFVRVLNNEWAKGIAENMLSDVVND